MSNDTIQRFIFDQTDVRCEAVRLVQSYQDVLANQHYEPVVARLLGEFMAACVMISSNMKFEGRLSLQARSEGTIAMIMAEATDDFGIRAIANCDGDLDPQDDTDLAQLLPRGTLAITIEPRNGKRYQGIVPLAESSLADCLATYFKQSEQLESEFWLAADHERGVASGVLIQALPAQEQEDPEAREANWQHLTQLAHTIKPEELLLLDQESLMYRLYHQDSVRLLQTSDVRFQCSCSRERTERALLSLGREEVDAILQEQGTVDLDCQFCHRQYQFSRDEVSELFGYPPSPALH